MRLATLVGALALLVAPRARADAPDEARQLIDAGLARMQANDLVGAREAFARARDLVPEKPNPYRWLGIADARLGRYADAVAELDMFIKRVPPSDPRSVEAATLRDRCKEELKPKTGTLVVDSLPEGAAVRVDDGAVVGQTPYRNEAMAIGHHTVALQRDGFQDVRTGVDVSTNEVVRLKLVLPAVPSPIAVAEPATAPMSVTAKPEPRAKRRYWIAAVVAGGVALGALAIGLGVGLGGRPSGTQLLDPVMGAP